MCGLDGIREIVLENEKMCSEKAETIIPFLRKIQKAYGDTLRKRLSKHAIQGKLRMRARELKRKVERSRELVPSLLKCLEQKSLEGCSVDSMPAVVTYALVLWALAGKKQGKGYGFPFDRPYLSFYGRLKALHPMLRKLNAAGSSEKKKDNKLCLTILRDLIETMEDTTLRKAAEQMQKKASVFDDLRKAMRIALPAGTRGINDRGSNEPMSTIAQRVKEFCDGVQGDESLSGRQAYKTMIAQFFRSWKRIYRKKSGMNALEKIMKAMPADTPLVKNLNDPQYMRILLDGKATLEERFAEIDARLIRKELAKLFANPDKVPPRIKKLIRQPDFPGQLLAIFTG